MSTPTLRWTLPLSDRTGHAEHTASASAAERDHPGDRRLQGVASTCKIAQLPMHESVRLGTGAEAALALQELGTWR
jgi:hypothetical protein